MVNQPVKRRIEDRRIVVDVTHSDGDDDGAGDAGIRVLRLDGESVWRGWNVIIQCTYVNDE